VIDHYRQDVADEIRRMTNNRRVDVVREHVGEATWARSMRSLARGGRLVTCGATSGADGAVNLQALFARQLTVRGSDMGTTGERLRAAPLFFAGQLNPVVDRTLPLPDARQAQRYLEESRQFGKIVLEV
jgi:NADPH:quinone reductase-like Zn-dependent oxidoreductase